MQSPTKQKQKQSQQINKQLQIDSKKSSKIKPPTPLKHHQQTFQDYQIQLTYQAHPYPIFTLKLLIPSQLSIYQLQLTKQMLQQMDPAVLATFQNLQAMYDQFVEIVRGQPQDLEIGEDGWIKVMVTVEMRSGVRKRELVLRAEKRPMTELEKFGLLVREREERSLRVVEELRGNLRKVQLELQETKNENKQLKGLITQLKTQLRSQVQSLKQKITTQKSLTHQLLHQFTQTVLQIKQNMQKIQFSVKALLSGASKIPLSPDMKSRCFKPGYRENSCYTIGSAVQPGEQGQAVSQRVKVTKIGKDKWTQLLFQGVVERPGGFFDLEVARTKRKYVCVGVCGRGCVDQEDSKWSKLAISLFLLDKSIIAQGKSIQNPTSQPQPLDHISTQSLNGSLQSQQPPSPNPKPQPKPPSPQKQPLKIRVIVNCLTKTIEWYENCVMIGIAPFSEEFLALCERGEVVPLVICVDGEDEILLG